MEADLKAVDRAVTPWVVMLGHKGWYLDSVDYSYFDSLAHEYGIDLTLVVCVGPLYPRPAPLPAHVPQVHDQNHLLPTASQGHVHDYERYFPVYGDYVDIQKDKSVYVNPSAMTTIVTGAGGNREMVGQVEFTSSLSDPHHTHFTL